MTIGRALISIVNTIALHHEHYPRLVLAPASLDMPAPADLQHFLSIPWCASIIGDVDKLDYIYPADEAVGLDYFHSRLLRSDGGISAFLVFANRISSIPHDPEFGIFTIRELSVMVDVGINVSGWPGVSHGGFTSSLLDMAGGWLGQCNVMQAIEEKKISPESGTMTKRLEVDYIKPVLVERVLLLTAKINKVEGRRLDIGITLEDERRMVLCRGRMFSVVVQPSSKI